MAITIESYKEMMGAEEQKGTMVTQQVYFLWLVKNPALLTLLSKLEF